MEKTRDIAFDIAKGIGIVLVVIGHYEPADSPAWYVEFVRFIYGFHMPLFFFIAGFFYDRSTRKESYRSFVWGKFQRLMVPYFILSWALVGVKLLFEGVMRVDHPVTLDTLYQLFYLPKAGYFLWFVYALFLVFCIVPFFKAGKRLVLLTILALGLAFWISAPMYFCLRPLCMHFIFFVVGMWVSRVVWLQRFMSRYLLLWTVATVVLTVLQRDVSQWYVLRLLSIAVGVTGSFMVLSLSHVVSLRDNLFSGWLQQLGVLSMTVYLFHTWVMGGGKAILTYILSGGNTIEFVLSALFIIGMGILVPVGLYRWVWSKNKFTSRIFK